MRRIRTDVTSEQLERELRRERDRRNYRRTLLSTASALVIVAALAVLVSMLALPVLQLADRGRYRRDGRRGFPFARLGACQPAPV